MAGGGGGQLQELELQARYPGAGRLGVDFVTCRQWILDNPSAMSSTPSSKPSESFACPNCDKVYRHKHNLRRHVKVECGKAPQLQCGYCDMRFKHKCTLQKHVDRKHSGANH